MMSYDEYVWHNCAGECGCKACIEYEESIDIPWEPTHEENVETAFITLSELGYDVELIRDDSEFQIKVRIKIDTFSTSVDRVKVASISEDFPDWGIFLTLYNNDRYLGLLSHWLTI